MDKYEYKVRSEEIKSLIGQGNYAQAAEIADTIDWRRVKSVMMLCTVSDLYKINRRYEDAKNMLLLAYERRPGGRTICYSLCELCIKTEEFVQALKYFKEFVQAAPKDSGRYILQYKLYEAQEVSLEERISVLEELKKRDYREKWAYELAYLYHRVGLATRCVEECDELILWFGEGKYVVKAMELKMLHQPLTKAQQDVYDRRFEEELPDGGQEEQEYYEDGAGRDSAEPQEDYGWPGDENPEEEGDEAAYTGESVPVQEPSEEMDIQVKTMDVGKYNTINLQAELAAGLQEVLGADGMAQEGNGAEERPQALGADAAADAGYQNFGAEEIEDSEVFFGATGEMEDILPEPAPGEAEEPAEETDTGGEPENTEEQEYASEPEAVKEPGYVPEREDGIAGEDFEPEDKTVVQNPAPDGQPPKELAEVLSQEANGQISIVVPESAAVEKQITGQMKLEDILAEWERIKKESEAKCQEEVRKHVLNQTGPMFTEFEANVRDGLLEQLEKGENPQTDAQESALPTEPAEESAQDAAPEPHPEDTREAERTEAAGLTVQGGAGVLAEESAGQVVSPQEETETGEEAAYGAEPGAADEMEAEDWQDDPGDEFAVEAGYGETGDGPEDGYIGDTGNGAAEYAEYIEESGAEDELVYTDEDTAGTDYMPGAGYEDEAEYAEEPEAGYGGEYAGEPDVEDEAEYVGEYEPDSEPEYDEEYGYEAEAGAGNEPEYMEEAGYEDEAAYAGAYETDGAEPEYTVTENEYEEKTEANSEYIDEAGYREDELTFAEDGPEEKDIVEEIEEIQEQVEAAESPLEKAESAKNRTESEDKQDIDRDQAKVRSLTREEKELFAPYIQNRRSREQLVKALDGVSMAAYTGNLIITGEEGMDTLTLAKNMMREIRMIDSNFSGKVAKVSGQGLNHKDVAKTLEQLNNGALIIQKASGMNSKTAAMLHRQLQHERFGIIVVLEDTEKAIKKLFLGTPDLYGDFTARVDLEALSNDTLVAFGRQYAREKEYSIDNLGVLALHTRIEELQTIDHVVTVMEVKQIMDEAMHRASRKTLRHFFDILLARRYDDEDMVILTEKDFVA